MDTQFIKPGTKWVANEKEGGLYHFAEEKTDLILGEVKRGYGIWSASFQGTPQGNFVSLSGAKAEVEKHHNEQLLIIEESREFFKRAMANTKIDQEEKEKARQELAKKNSYKWWQIWKYPGGRGCTKGYK